VQHVVIDIRLLLADAFAGHKVGAVNAAMAAHGMDLSAVATPAALKQLQPTAGTLNAAGGRGDHFGLAYLMSTYRDCVYDSSA
jgi:hypothetical protein